MTNNYKDPDVLSELYHEQGMSQRDIAEMFGCAQGTIYNWMKKFDIKSRKEGRPIQTPRLYMNCGYEKFTSADERFKHHRLLAVAEFGWNEVVNKDVHHKNWIPWDNRPENIEMLPHSEHVALHAQQEREMKMLADTLGRTRKHRPWLHKAKA